MACIYDGLGVSGDRDPAVPLVEMGTRIALADGSLPAIEPLSGQAALERSKYWLSQLRSQFEQQGFTGTVAVYVIDGDLWSTISDAPVNNGQDLLSQTQRLQLMTHARPPEQGERMLLINEATLSAVIHGAMSLEQAQKAGLARLKIKNPKIPY